jgi:hypothetical protein
MIEAARGEFFPRDDEAALLSAGIGRSTTPWTRANMAVVLPMPNAMVTMTVAVNARARNRLRQARWTS